MTRELLPFFNLAAKHKRKYREKCSLETWFILTNLSSLDDAIDSYSKRMGIEEMFRDFKGGAYNLEDTRVSKHRLISLVLLITLSYSYSTLCGKSIKAKGFAQYVTRPTESQRKYSRHSSFSIGFHSQNWLDSIAFFQDVVQESISFYPYKQSYYQKGMRAISLIQQAL